MWGKSAGGGSQKWKGKFPHPVWSAAYLTPSRDETMNRRAAQLGLQSACLLLVFLAAPDTASAQQSTQTTSDNSTPQTVQTSAPAPDEKQPEDKEAGDAVKMFPHSESSRYWISGQANIILQWHGSFPAKYSGPNSLHPQAENATSKVFTLYLGYELTHTT